MDSNLHGARSGPQPCGQLGLRYAPRVLRQDDLERLERGTPAGVGVFPAESGEDAFQHRCHGPVRALEEPLGGLAMSRLC